MLGQNFLVLSLQEQQETPGARRKGGEDRAEQADAKAFPVANKNGGADHPQSERGEGQEFPHEKAE